MPAPFKIIRRFPIYDAYTDALRGMDSENIGHTETVEGAQAWINAVRAVYGDDSTFHVYPFDDLDCQVDARQVGWDKLKAETAYREEDCPF